MRDEGAVTLLLRSDAEWRSEEDDEGDRADTSSGSEEGRELYWFDMGWEGMMQIRDEMLVVVDKKRGEKGGLTFGQSLEEA